MWDFWNESENSENGKHSYEESAFRGRDFSVVGF